MLIGYQYNCSGGVRAYSGAPIGVTTLGVECPGSLGSRPRIGATFSPNLGSTWRVNLSRTVPGVGAVLVMGLNATQWWGIPLPFDLGAIGMPGCLLRVSPDFVFPALTVGNPAAGGRAQVTFAIPPDPTLAGADAYFQWWVADPGPWTPGGSATRALQATLQP